MRVLVPAVIPGGPASIGLMNSMELAFEPVAPWWNVWGYVRKIGPIFTIIRSFGLFFLRANPIKAKSYDPILKYTRNVKKDLPAGAKLGVCGFCWGGYPSTKLCTEASFEGGDERLIDAQFCAHPSALKVPDMVVDAVVNFKVPYSMALGTKDFVLTKTQAEQTEAALRQKTEGAGEGEFAFEVQYYQDCQHGFAVRAKPGDEVQEKAAEDAYAQAIAWFKKWL